MKPNEMSNQANNQLIKDMFSFYSKKYEDAFFLDKLKSVKSKILFLNLLLILPILTISITMKLDLFNFVAIYFVFYCLSKQYKTKKILETICWQRSANKKEIFLCNVKLIIGDESYYETFQSFKKSKISNEIRALLEENENFNNYEELLKRKFNFKEETMITFTKEKNN